MARQSGCDGKFPCRESAYHRQYHLPSVGVPGEHPADVERGGFSQTSRVVRQQEHRRPRAAQGPRHFVGAARPEPDASDVQRCTFHDDPSPVVEQHRDALSFECGRHRAIVVMVAEHREDAARRIEGRQQLGHGPSKAAIPRCDEVAPQQDQVWRERPCQGHRSLDIDGRHQRAVVEVGKECDAEAIVSGVEAGDREIGSRELEPMPLMRGPISEAAYAETDPAVQQRRQEFASGKQHLLADPRVV